MVSEEAFDGTRFGRYCWLATDGKKAKATKKRSRIADDLQKEETISPIVACKPQIT